MDTTNLRYINGEGRAWADLERKEMVLSILKKVLCAAELGEIDGVAIMWRTRDTEGKYWDSAHCADSILELAGVVSKFEFKLFNR